MLANLMRSELSRLRFRRRAWGSLILMLLIGVTTPLAYADQIRQPTPGELAVARAELLRMRTSGECPDCTLSDVTGHVTFNNAIGTLLPSMALLFAFLAFMIVITYVGADFTSGALATQLTFTPRRSVLLAARTVACGVLGAVLMLAAMVSAVSSTIASYLAVNGAASIGDATGLLGLMGGSALYGFLLGVIAALGTFIVRNTALSMTVALAVLIASVMLGETTVQEHPWLYRLLPLYTGIAILTGKAPVAPIVWTDVMLTWADAVVFHLGVIAVLAVVAVIVFERRDIKG